MSIVALDSATPPTADQVAQARAGGIAQWNGYLASRPNVGLARPWTQAEFEVVKTFPARPLGYCSGADDPAAVRALADAWGVRPCLDVESGIRDDGPWVQGWIDACGRDVCGLYGVQSVHNGRLAAFHVLGTYPAGGNPSGASWDPVEGPVPDAPHGWQWQNTHQEFGVGVDRCTMDDWFAAQEEEDMQGFIVYNGAGSGFAVFPTGHKAGIPSQADLAALRATGQFVEVPPSEPISSAFLAQLPDVSAAVGQPGPAGPEGPAGPPGPAGSVVNHQHLGGTTGPVAP